MHSALSTDAIVISIFAIAAVILALEATGLLPRFISRYINRNRYSQTIDILQDLGVDVQQTRKTLLGAKIKSFFSKGRDHTEEAKRRVAAFTYSVRVRVGKENHSDFSAFIDLMGASTNSSTAILFAKILSTYVHQLIVNQEINADFDAIACPKDGSPILAYEFSRLTEKPLILCPAVRKFEADEFVLNSLVDIGFPKGTDKILKALLVDDSTTGGRKAINAVETLNKCGIRVTDFVVVFEPKGKGARETLLGHGITLHSLLPGPEGVA